jgi:hypothetical protein
MIINDELIRIKMELVVTYFKTLVKHLGLPVETAEIPKIFC